jgi:hypothetical protein
LIAKTHERGRKGGARLSRHTQERPFDRDGIANFDACLEYPDEATEETLPLLKCLAVKGETVGHVAIVSSLTHSSQLPLKEIGSLIKSWRLLLPWRDPKDSSTFLRATIA